MDSTTYTFTNSDAARRFVRAQGGPIEIGVENPKRGLWIVTITPKS